MNVSAPLDDDLPKKMGHLQMVLVDRCPVFIERKRRSKWYELVCCGSKSHFRKAGGCKHADDVMNALLPNVRSRARVRPFGATAK